MDISCFTEIYAFKFLSTNGRDLIISEFLMTSVLVQIKAMFPYWPSINSCLRKFSPRRSLAVLSSMARWMEDTTHTAVQFFKCCKTDP